MIPCVTFELQKLLISSHSLCIQYISRMEASQPLSIESFSYSWLANLKPSFESPDNSFDGYDEASFIEMDPKLSSSKRFFRVPQDFDFPVSQTPLALVHADELISNGFLMPLFVKQLKVEASYDDASSNSISTSSDSSCAPKKFHSGHRLRCSSLRRCRKLSKQIFQKYMDLLRPLCHIVRGRRSGSRARSSDGRLQEVSSTATSPRASVAYSVDNWRMSCDSESSIYEAVLHCKRTIGE